MSSNTGGWVGRTFVWFVIFLYDVIEMVQLQCILLFVFSIDECLDSINNATILFSFPPRIRQEGPQVPEALQSSAGGQAQRRYREM